MAIDVFLASHASQFKLHEKYKPGDAFNPDRFVDPQGFKAAVEELEKTYRDQLAQRARAQVSRYRAWFSCATGLMTRWERLVARGPTAS